MASISFSDTRSSSREQVRVKAPLSPASPPVMGTPCPSSATVPAIRSLPFTATPWDSRMTAFRSGAASCSARRRPAPAESSMPAMSIAAILKGERSRRTAVTTMESLFTPWEVISPAVDKTMRLASGNAFASQPGRTRSVKYWGAAKASTRLGSRADKGSSAHSSRVVAAI